MIPKDKEDIFMKVLNALRSHDVHKAISELQTVQDPCTAAWIGMGVMYVVGTEYEYTDTFEQFRTALEEA